MRQSSASKIYSLVGRLRDSEPEYYGLVKNLRKGGFLDVSKVHVSDIFSGMVGFPSRRDGR